MHFDFSAALVIATFLTGIIAAIYWLIQRAKPSKVAGQKEPIIIEYSKSFFPVLLIVLVVRSFIVEPFRIPSSSMMPSLLIGDFILVNKFSYGVHLPVINTKIIEVGKPERGDVMVFRYPNKPSLDYIKRVVGLPGDKIGYFNKTLFVNGKKVEQIELGKYQAIGAGINMDQSQLRQEQLPSKAHDILIMPERPSIEGEAVVPAGHYFMMGDNRDNSNDSRYWGTVPEANIVGKAFMIWMNWDGGIDFKRLGSTIN